ncbi:MAG: hypothetical protein V2A79_13900 [Planctomycetota bacterium]
MEVAEITSLDGLVCLRERWRELLRENDTNVVFLTPEYIRSWWEVWGAERELLVLVAKKDT